MATSSPLVREMRQCARGGDSVRVGGAQRVLYCSREVTWVSEMQSRTAT